MMQATIQGTLSVVPPFDFQQSLRFLEHFPPVYGEQNIASYSITKAISIDRQCVVFQLTSTGTIEQPELSYTLYSAQPLSNSQQQATIEHIRFFLSLDDDLQPFYAIAKTDACFAPNIDHLYGLHHVKFLTLCEAACWSILTQHRAIPLARKQKQILVERYGCSLEIAGKTYRAFPERERLAEVSPQELAEVLKDERRASYISGVISALERFDEQFLRTAPYDEAEAALLSIKGIGAWSAAFILMRGLGRMERMLFDLKPFLKALPEVYGPEATMQQIAERYGPWFGYWGFYFRVAH